MCRCTGYRPILEGYKLFTAEANNHDKWAATGNTTNHLGGGCGVQSGCCKNNTGQGGCCKEMQTNGHISNGGL